MEEDTMEDQAYLITVDYSLSLAEMISVCQFDWVNPDIEKHSSVKQSGKASLKVKIVNPFNQHLVFEKFVAQLDQGGYRQATVPELLAFARQYPEIRREFSIVALGTTWYCHTVGDDVYPALDGTKGQRGLANCQSVWSMNPNYRWLVVKKENDDTVKT
jgi:hypothetical protein